ncbi:MAG: PQQ-dependent sugar dehydrogenase [Pseudomonadota bacterium]
MIGTVDARSARALVCIVCALTLAACGGSSSDTPVADAPPTTTLPSLSIGDAVVTEGNSGNVTLQFTVTSSAAASGQTSTAAASVEFATSDDSALAGTDFEATSGTLEFPNATGTATIDVIVLGDTDVEVDETLSVTLSAPSNATLARAIATGTIRDDDTVVAAFGLDTRPDNSTCIAPARPTSDASVSISDPYPNLPDFSQPTKLLLEPAGAGRWFVLQKSGQIQTFAPGNPTGTTEYMDLTDTRSIRTRSEGGLLGMAFHPDYPATPEIFLSYTIDHSGPPMRHVVSRMVLDDVTAPGAGTIEQILLEVDQDFDNHNGGDIAFGPDGALYFGLGDGGSGNDPLARSQDTTRLLGSMLRIDVIGTGASYNIPADNPFASNSQCGAGNNADNCPEIYAWGLRNPWRWSFDPDSGALWLADVGQGAREEVNLIERGGNYGWRCREGTLDTGNASDCATNELIDPVTEYPRNLGNSITGGQVYRGTAIPELSGLYIFADYGSGRFWAARPDGQGGYENDELINTNLNPTAFNYGPDGELYFVDINGSNGSGRVRRLDPAASPIADTVPELLSDTGCVDATNTSEPYDGLVPYDLNAPFWSDGADKDRYIGLPNGTTMTINAIGDFEFPNGTVIVKNFRIGGELVETRHLMRHTDGVWAGYTYEWNAAQTEATRVRGGKVRRVNGQDWIYPSQAQCMECHTGAAGFALGPEVAQLNKTFTYPSTGRTANQLETLQHVMMFDAPLPDAVSALDVLADPADTAQPVELRARAYLHTNCAQCHRPNGPTPSTLDLRYDTPLTQTNACDEQPLEGDLGIANARLIAPGDANASLVIERMQRRDIHGMPPVGSNRIDTDGVSTVAAWINGLPGCD